MRRINRRKMLGLGAITVAGLAPAVAAAAGNQPVVAQPGQPLNITVTTTAAAPDVSIVLGPRAGRAVPVREGCTHTGGGNIAVAQPSADTLVLTLSGVAVAYGAPGCAGHAALNFDVNQAFEVSFDNPKVKAAKLTLEGQVVGFLRSHKHGSADECASANVSATAGAPGALAISMPNHSVGCNENLAINDKEGPVSCVVAAGKYCINASFRVSASMPKTAFPGKAPSAEFHDGALDPLWISYKEPFKGAKKGDCGFQITLKVTPEEVPDAADKK